jgi:hypothetical protein
VKQGKKEGKEIFKKKGKMRDEKECLKKKKRKSKVLKP